MQNLNGRSRLEKKSCDFESPDGLQNFAPLGSVSIRMYLILTIFNTFRNWTHYVRALFEIDD